MKNIFDVMKQKEDELKRLQNEVDALRIAARLLADDTDAVVMHAASQPVSHVKPAPAFAPMHATASGNGSGAYSAAWGNAPRQFP